MSSWTGRSRRSIASVTQWGCSRGDGGAGPRVELIVLGAGPSYTNVKGAIGASYLLVDGDHALLLDFGQGAFPSLANAWEPSSLAAVVISHLPPDHYIDLVALRHYLRYEFSPP